MLIAMSFNFWFILAIVSGLATSDFLFTYLQDCHYISKTNQNIASGKLSKENLLNKWGLV